MRLIGITFEKSLLYIALILRIYAVVNLVYPQSLNILRKILTAEWINSVLRDLINKCQLSL